MPGAAPAELDATDPGVLLAPRLAAWIHEGDAVRADWHRSQCLEDGEVAGRRTCRRGRTRTGENSDRMRPRLALPCFRGTRTILLRGPSSRPFRASSATARGKGLHGSPLICRGTIQQDTGYLELTDGLVMLRPVAGDQVEHAFHGVAA
jgi:hypothetical protein